MRSRRLAAVWIALSALALCSCARSSALRNQVSEHFRTVRGTFMVDVKAGTVRYDVAYDVVAPFSDPVIVRVSFETPLESQPDLVVERLLTPAERRLHVQSPPLLGMASGSYDVLLVAVHAATGVELGRHLQTLQFYIADGILPSPGP